MSKPRRSKSPAKPANDTPLVSVIMPAYNAARFIGHSIASVLDQRYKHFELLVVNDASSDGTEEIIKRYAARDARVRYLEQPNAGISAARNLAIARAKGEFIAPLDSDDLWHPAFLERQLARMREAGPRVGLSYTWALNIDDSNAFNGNAVNFVIEGEVYLKMICSNFVLFPGSCLMRKATLEQIGYYDTSGEFSGDWDLNLRIAEVAEYRCVPEYLAFYRRHRSSVSHNLRYMEAGYRAILNKVRKAHPEVPARIFRWSRGLFSVYMANQALANGAIGTCLRYLTIAALADPTTPIRVLGNRLRKRLDRNPELPRPGLAGGNKAADADGCLAELMAIAERMEPVEETREMPLGFLRNSRLRFIDGVRLNAAGQVATR